MRNYLNSEEAATYLNISKSTLAKRRIYGGGPRFTKFGAAVRYAKSDLDAFMADNSVHQRPSGHCNPMEDHPENGLASRQQVDPILTADAAPATPCCDPDVIQFEFHELANIFPMPNAGKLGQLAQDISELGLRDPIMLHEGKILDGRSRYSACVQIGVQPTFEDFHGDNALAFVISRNLHRRHLDESQRAMVAAMIANLPIGGNQHAEGLPIGAASELLNVSARSVARAKEVLKSSNADLIAAVQAGKVAVSAAATMAQELNKSAAVADNTEDVEAADNAADMSASSDTNSEHGVGDQSSDDADHSQRPILNLGSILEPGVTLLFGGASSATLLMAVKIAATASAGALWPDHTRASSGEVVWLSTQLDADKLLRPQIVAAAAQPQRVHFFKPRRDDFGLPVRDLADELQRLKRDVSAETTCVVIDYLPEYFNTRGPVQSILPGFAKAMATMNEIAREKRVAIIGICEIPGRDDRQVIEAVMQIGSLPAVGAVLRVVRTEKPNRGSLILLPGTNERRFPFQLRKVGGESVVVWDDVAVASASAPSDGVRL